MIEKVLFYAHFGLSLLYVAQGYAIGWAIHRMTGRGGPGLALVAVGIMIASLAIGHLVMAYDILSVVRNANGGDPSLTVGQIFPMVIKNQNIMHWVCIAFGLYACYRGGEQQQG